MPHHAPRDHARAQRRWFVPTLLGLTLSAATLPGQDPTADVARARTLAATQPAEALRLVASAIDAGLDRYDAHLLLAELRFAAGDFAGARAAVERAMARLAQDQQSADELRRRIAAAASAARPQPGAASAPAPRPATPPDPARVRREADALRDQGQLAAAAERYSALATVATGKEAEDAKDQIVFVARALAAKAEAAAHGTAPATPSTPSTTTPPSADSAAQDRDAAFHQAETLHRDHDDTDRSLEALESLMQSQDQATRDRARDLVLAWLREDIERSNEAGRNGDAEARSRHLDRTKKYRPLLVGSPGDGNRTEADRRRARDTLRAGCSIDDPRERRRWLEAYAAWAKQQWQLAELALREHDTATAGALQGEAADAITFFEARGEDGLAADVHRLRTASADRAVAAAARAQQTERADALEGRARTASANDDPAAAAELLAAAYRYDPARMQLGMEAAALYARIGRRVQAVRLYEALAQSVDPQLAAAARRQVEDLRAWASEAYRSIASEVRGALDAKQVQKAIDLAAEPLAILDPNKLEAARDGVVGGQGTDAQEIIRTMGQDLAKGAFPPLPEPVAATADAASSQSTAPAPLLDRPPESGEPFAASLRVLLQPIAPTTFRRSDGVTVAITQPFWTATDFIDGTQTREYLAAMSNQTPGRTLNVSWNRAIMFCRYLTARERTAGRLPAGYCYTLPTEAEWELLHAHDDPAAGTTKDGLPILEWCLDAVDQRGHAQDAGDTTDPCSLVGTHRVCRSLVPARARSAVEPWRPDASFRVVLALRPEVEEPANYR